MAKKNWTVKDSVTLYQIDKWGKNLFAVNDKGHLCVTPTQKSSIDIYEVLQEIKSKNIQLPAVIRFHDILKSKVIEVNKSFNKMIKDYNYQGKYYGVFPVKVNPLREVVEEIVEIGKRYNFGLEAGSKSELLAVLAYNTNPEGLTILNGYKDEEFIRLALMGIQLGRKVFLVIENLSELERILHVSKELKVTPQIGIRIKMSKIGQGKWADSTGDNAKFGLSIPEVLKALEILREAQMLFSFQLIHFHIGSQISDIRYIKEAISEAGRMFAKLIKMGAHLQFLDVGGGLGIDYDGSKSHENSSINYSIEEYASDIIYGIQQICDVEKVPHPHLISESGRALTAHHSCVISKVIDISGPPLLNDFHIPEKKDTDHLLLNNIRDLYHEINETNLNESYNDLLQLKDESRNAFRLGILDLQEKGTIEILFWKGCKKILDFFEGKITDLPDFYFDLKEKFISQYLCNFSLFQSAADVWAIGQILPIVPINRLDERPSEKGIICDITCDSDGQIRKYISDNSDDVYGKSMPLHAVTVNGLKENDYYIGLFLTGAYQDVMGDMHNLFGRLNEVHVYSDEEDPSEFYIEEFIKGSSIKHVLMIMQYNPTYMAKIVKEEIDKRVQKGLLRPRTGVELTDMFEEALKKYTYYD